jgi:ethanolamine utilization protein EutP (predicted NTPase)
MANQIDIVPTEFKDTHDGTVTLGVRVYDNYEQFYINTWKNIPDDDLDLLDKVLMEAGDSDIFCYLQEEEKGVTIRDTYYEWDEIKHLFA